MGVEKVLEEVRGIAMDALMGDESNFECDSGGDGEPVEIMVVMVDDWT